MMWLSRWKCSRYQLRARIECLLESIATRAKTPSLSSLDTFGSSLAIFDGRSDATFIDYLIQLDISLIRFDTPITLSIGNEKTAEQGAIVPDISFSSVAQHRKVEYKALTTTPLPSETVKIL